MDINVGHVVCRELGYPGAEKITTYAAFGEGEGHVLLTPKCIGNETTLLHCEHTGWGKKEKYCDHSHDSGVFCIDGEYISTVMQSNATLTLLRSNHIALYLVCFAESLSTGHTHMDSCNSLLVSTVIPIIICCVTFSAITIGMTAYIVIRRKRRKMSQRKE